MRNLTNYPSLVLYLVRRIRYDRGFFYSSKKFSLLIVLKIFEGTEEEYVEFLGSWTNKQGLRIMMFFRRSKSKIINKDELYSNVEQIIESFRPELVSKIEEFQAMENLRCMKHIRTWILVSEIEKGKVLKKLILLWVSGIFGYLFKFLQKDLSMDKLKDKDLDRIYKDTRQNFAKSTLKQINRSLAVEFTKVGYDYKSVQLEDPIESWQWNKRRPRTVQGKFWWITSKLFSASKLPSILAVVLSAISASMYYLMTWLTAIIQNTLKFTLLVSILIHFISGMANAVSIFYQWLEDIAEQVEELSKAQVLDSETLAGQWIDRLKEQAKVQIETPNESSWTKAALVGCMIVLLGGFTVFSYWPGSTPVDTSTPGLAVNDILTPGDPNSSTPIVEVIDKEALLNRLHKWGEITLLTKSGSNLLFERTIPKKIFGGTIPTTDLQVKVTYDYSTNFVLDLTKLTEAGIEIENDRVKVYLPQPTRDEIRITNDRKEMSGAVFADNGTPEEEIEAFEPGDESYWDILRKNVEIQLLMDQELQSKVKWEAINQLQTRILDSDEIIKAVEVILQD